MGTDDAVAPGRAAVIAQGRPVARGSMDGYHHRRAHRHRQGRYHAAGHRYLAEVDPRRRATIVIDNNDRARPRLVRSER